MSQRQPLTKAELQKMILQVMYELKYGRMSKYAPGMDSIIPYWINEYYSIQLTTAEKMLARETVEDLKNAGLIVQDANREEEIFQVLTQKGKDTLLGKQEQEPKNPLPQSVTLKPQTTTEPVREVKLEELITNKDLLETCQQSFNNYDYKTAIASSIRFLETKTDAAAQLGGKDFGTVLMAKAVSPFMGKLTVAPEAGIEVQDGILNLFGGAVAVFGKLDNIPIDYNDRRQALKIIAFIELLVDMLSKAQIKS